MKLHQARAHRERVYSSRKAFPVLSLFSSLFYTFASTLVQHIYSKTTRASVHPSGFPPEPPLSLWLLRSRSLPASAAASRRRAERRELKLAPAASKAPHLTPSPLPHLTPLGIHIDFHYVIPLILCVCVLFMGHWTKKYNFYLFDFQVGLNFFMANKIISNFFNILFRVLYIFN